METIAEKSLPTTEQIIDGNKLIGELMELNTGWLYHKSQITAAMEYEFIFEPTVKPSVVEYHTSWDWLMPVFFKIQKKYRPHTIEITPFSTIIYLSGKIKIVCGARFLDEGTEGDLKYKYIPTEEGIFTTWTAVVEFLKWINENKK